MNRNDLTITLSAILLACFFIPVVQWDSYEMSGMNFILSDFTPDTKYIFLICPGSCFILLLGTLSRTKWATERNILRVLPLLSVIILFVICFSENPGGSSFSHMDMGAWGGLIGSFQLAFMNLRTERSPVYSKKFIGVHKRF